MFQNFDLNKNSFVESAPGLVGMVSFNLACLVSLAWHYSGENVFGEQTVLFLPVGGIL